jgi:hypothetical protein
MAASAAAIAAIAAGALVYFTQQRDQVVAASPPDVRAATELRRTAVAACNAHAWAECLAGLDKARALDPSGDAEPSIAAARDRAIQEILRAAPR